MLNFDFIQRLSQFIKEKYFINFMVRTFNLLAIIIIVNFLAKKYYFRINFDFMVNSAMVVR